TPYEIESGLQLRRVLFRSRAGEPVRARHGPVLEHGSVRGVGLDLEVLPDGGPEVLDLGHRPVIELVPPGEVTAVSAVDPVDEVADVADGQGIGRHIADDG